MNDINCPNCKSRKVIRKGKRKTKYNLKQVFYCKDCKKHFVDKKMHNKTYPAKVIINSINYYNLGYTLSESSSLVNRRFKIKTSKSSIQRWVSEYSDICSFQKIRKQVISEYKQDEIIFIKIFKHRGLQFVFKYHRAKLKEYAMVFPGLIRYIKSFEKGCPNEVFEGGLRCSQICLNVDIKKSCKKNQACQLCRLALLSAKDNKKRHSILEEFMLINDNATVACEVPVWFWDKKRDIGISGHIDLLQIRSGKIYVMDFKPGKKNENEQKVASQLYLYARALNYRTRIPLKNFICAWFDENGYYEFSPSEIKTKKKRNIENSSIFYISSIILHKANVFK